MYRYIVASMKKSNIIDADNEAVILFGLRGILFLVLNLISTFIIAFAMSSFFYTGFFLLNYACIRSFSGGYHASSRLKCYILSCIIIIIASFLIARIDLSVNAIIMLFVVNFIIIIGLSPLENALRKLSGVEKERYRKTILVIVFLQMVLLCLPVGIRYKTALVLANSCVSMLLIIGLIAGKMEMWKKN